MEPLGIKQRACSPGPGLRTRCRLGDDQPLTWRTPGPGLEASPRADDAGDAPEAHGLVRQCTRSD